MKNETRCILWPKRPRNTKRSWIERINSFNIHHPAAAWPLAASIIILFSDFSVFRQSASHGLPRTTEWSLPYLHGTTALEQRMRWKYQLVRVARVINEARPLPRVYENKMVHNPGFIQARDVKMSMNSFVEYPVKPFILMFSINMWSKVLYLLDRKIAT